MRSRSSERSPPPLRGGRNPHRHAQGLDVGLVCTVAAQSNQTAHAHLAALQAETTKNVQEVATAVEMVSGSSSVDNAAKWQKESCACSATFSSDHQFASLSASLYSFSQFY